MRSLRPILIALMLTQAGACARVGTAPPPGPAERPTPEARSAPAQTTWGGTFTLEGQEVPVVLELRGGDPSPYSATLHIPEMSVEARGGGSWSGNRIRADLDYGQETACPGRIDLDVRVSEDGTRAQGSLTARDCTGSESGPLILARRGASPATSTPLR